MEEQEKCRKCHGGILHPTLDPKEKMCNLCGWTCITMNLADFVACKGKLDNN